MPCSNIFPLVYLYIIADVYFRVPSVVLALSVMLIYVKGSFVGFLASLGVNSVLECTNFELYVNHMGYINSVRCWSGFIRLSNISLKVWIVFGEYWMPSWWDVCYIVYRQILLKEPSVCYAGLSACHYNLWWPSPFIHALNEPKGEVAFWLSLYLYNCTLV